MFQPNVRSRALSSSAAEAEHRGRCVRNRVRPIQPSPPLAIIMGLAIFRAVRPH
jgi:hypothetical protein